MKRYFITTIIASLICTASCRKEIEFKASETERVIVLNSVIHPDSLFTANVFRSNHVADNFFDLLYLNNATVNVFEKGNLIETLKLQNDGYYVGYGFNPETGHEYSFEVESPNLAAVSGKVKIPPVVPIDSIDSVGAYNPNYDYYYPDAGIESGYTMFRVYFKDAPNTDNFYRIKATANIEPLYDTIYFDDGTKNYYVNYYSTSAISEDPAIEVYSYRDGYYYFSDLFFKGKTYGFEISVPLTDEPAGKKVYFMLEQVSKGFYRYIKSLDMQSEAQDMQLFYQAVQVFNNINNGFGIVGSTAVSKDSVVME